MGIQEACLLGYIEPIEDIFECSAVLFAFANNGQSVDLGFVDRNHDILDVSLKGYEANTEHIDQDFRFRQSRTHLNSEKSSTGYVLWKISLRFARFVHDREGISSWIYDKLLSDTVNSSINVLELGSGCTGIIALAMEPYVDKYFATDRDKHLLALLRENIRENSPMSQKIGVVELDWEKKDHITADLSDTNLILCFDVVYNEYLIPFLISTIEFYIHSQVNAIAMVGLQLRSEDILISFLEMLKNHSFKIYRVTEKGLPTELQVEQGIVLFIVTLNQVFKNKDSM